MLVSIPRSLAHGQMFWEDSQLHPHSSQGKGGGRKGVHTTPQRAGLSIVLITFTNFLLNSNLVIWLYLAQGKLGKVVLSLSAMCPAMKQKVHSYR